METNRVLGVEICLLTGPRSTSPQELASDLYRKHLLDSNPEIMKTPFPVATDLCVQLLREKFSHVTALGEKLRGVAQRVHDGTICSIRRFEMELLEAGMVGARSTLTT